MLALNIYFDTSVYVYTYMFIYNTTLILFFWTLFAFTLTELKSLQSLSNMGLNAFITTLLTVLLLSMAGIPPFIGFFSKLFVITLLLHSQFLLFYPLLFTVFLLGIYFYIQNIRFLHSTNIGVVNSQFLFNERRVLLFYYVSITGLVLILFGFIWVDDIVLFFSWLLY